MVEPISITILTGLGTIITGIASIVKIIRTYLPVRSTTIAPLPIVVRTYPPAIIERKKSTIDLDKEKKSPSDFLVPISVIGLVFVILGLFVLIVYRRNSRNNDQRIDSSSTVSSLRHSV